MSDSPKFLPIIPSITTEDGKTELRRAFKSAAKSSLGIKACAEAIAPFKTNGNVLGHKVLDDGKAVEELIRVAPEPFKSTLGMAHLSLYEKIQGLNAVLRNQYEMDRAGKLTGRLSKRLLERKPATDQQS